VSAVPRARSAWEAIGAESAEVRFNRRVVGARQYEWLDNADKVVATEEYERGTGRSRLVNKPALLQVGPKSYEMRRWPGAANSSWKNLIGVTDLQTGQTVISPGRHVPFLLSATLVLFDGERLRVRCTVRSRLSARRYNFVTVTDHTARQVLCVRFRPASPTDPYPAAARLEAVVRHGCPTRHLIPLVALAGDILTFTAGRPNWPSDYEEF
jgi:hypothetical protein